MPSVRDLIRQVEAEADEDRGISAQLRRGSVCRVLDRAIPVPTSLRATAGERSYHPERWAIVVQADPFCANRRIPVVTDVPCSTKIRGQGPCDYLIPSGENGFIREPVVALVSLAQPILKTDILEVCGTLRDTTLGA